MLPTTCPQTMRVQRRCTQTVCPQNACPQYRCPKLCGFKLCVHIMDSFQILVSANFALGCILLFQVTNGDERRRKSSTMFLHILVADPMIFRVNFTRSSGDEIIVDDLRGDKLWGAAEHFHLNWNLKANFLARRGFLREFSHNVGIFKENFPTRRGF